MRSRRKEHDSSFCLEVQQRLKLLLLLLQKHRGWTSWFSIPGYHSWKNPFPVKLLFHKFHVPLRASQGTTMIPEFNWVSLPPLAWGLGTSLAIFSGQLKHRGFCHVLQVRLSSTGIISWLPMLFQYVTAWSLFLKKTTTESMSPVHNFVSFVKLCVKLTQLTYWDT